MVDAGVGGGAAHQERGGWWEGAQGVDQREGNRQDTWDGRKSRAEDRGPGHRRGAGPRVAEASRGRVRPRDGDWPTPHERGREAWAQGADRPPDLEDKRDREGYRDRAGARDRVGTGDREGKGDRESRRVGGSRRDTEERPGHRAQGPKDGNWRGPARQDQGSWKAGSWDRPRDRAGKGKGWVQGEGPQRGKGRRTFEVVRVRPNNAEGTGEY